jgi:hypothetical protein
MGQLSGVTCFNLSLPRTIARTLALIGLIAFFPVLPGAKAQLINISPAQGGQDAEQVGAIVVAVSYDRKGKAQKCRLLRSNAPFRLEMSTIEEIQKHWKCPLFAGGTVVWPIVFDSTSVSVKWNADLETPPLFFPYGDKKYSLKLRLTFGSDGWVKRVQIIQPSGVDLADENTAAWIQIHWHHAAYANQVVDAPFEFSRSLPPPPPPVPPKPAETAPPQEPVAIPAIRAE